MDVSPAHISEFPDPSNAAPTAGAQPTPDYGTLGPGSDLATGAGSSARHRVMRPFVLLSAFAFAVLVVVLTGRSNTPPVMWSDFENLAPSISSGGSSPASHVTTRQLDRMRPQKQAETLLQLAVTHSDGAVGQISSRLHRWQGRLKWDSQMATLTSAALNSNDMQVRKSGIEIELAAYGLSPNSASLEYLVKSAESGDHAQKIWALWALGLMGNRGVETARVVRILSAHLDDSDDEARHWAVQGLALVGTNESIPLLLTAMHDDRSALVREAAACGLAQSGMFSHEQRASAIPQLLKYTDDSSLDAQTQAWAFLALADITHQNLPANSNAWREWYGKSVASGQ